MLYCSRCNSLHDARQIMCYHMCIFLQFGGQKTQTNTLNQENADNILSLGSNEVHLSFGCGKLIYVCTGGVRAIHHSSAAAPGRKVVSSCRL